MPGITFWQNVEQWRRIEATAALGAKAGAEAMARYLAERTANDTLQRTSHAAGEYWVAATGAPPASASGNLASQMFWTRAQGSSTRAWATVGNMARYAKMQEFGCNPVSPTSAKVMHWKDSGNAKNPSGEWYHAILPADGSPMPAHPFLGPTIDEAVMDGGLQRAALEAFAKYDP
jgi:phage gpG-like protein